MSTARMKELEEEVVRLKDELADRKPTQREMAPEEFGDCLDRLGLSNKGAALMLGLSRRMVQRYLKESSDDGSPVPMPTAKLLRLAVQRNIPADEIGAL